LKAAVAAGIGVTVPAAARAQTGPQRMRPEEGDRFVFVSGEKQGAEITPDALPEGGPQVLAWPTDPKTKTIRDASRLSQVLLIRLAPESLDDATKAHAAEGIVAYAATCSHAQCPVTAWSQERKVFHCPCHQSEYDPRQDGKVVGGPAPRPLPALPLRIENGSLVAAGTFLGRVGFKPA
jgi:Rieske Fe-S protein